MTKNIFKLSHPVTVEGVEYRELEWREPKGRDLRKLLKATDFADAQHNLLVDLCEVPGEVLEEISAKDYATLMDRIAPLLEPPKRT